MPALTLIAAVTLAAGVGAIRPKLRSLMDTAIVDGNFRTLVSALEAAGLTATLDGAGPFTLLAPTDTAFRKLLPGTLEDLLKPQNKDRLVRLLRYHVLPGLVMASDLAGKTMKIITLAGVEASIASKNAIKIDGAMVLHPDIATVNGVIHAIDTVLNPA